MGPGWLGQTEQTRLLAEEAWGLALLWDSASLQPALLSSRRWDGMAQMGWDGEWAVATNQPVRINGILRPVCVFAGQVERTLLWPDRGTNL